MCLLHILPIKILPRSSQRQGLHSTSEGAGTSQWEVPIPQVKRPRLRFTPPWRRGKECKQRDARAQLPALHSLPPGKSQQKHRHACALQTPRAVSRIPAQLDAPTIHQPRPPPQTTCPPTVARVPVEPRVTGTHAQWTSTLRAATQASESCPLCKR